MSADLKCISCRQTDDEDDDDDAADDDADDDDDDDDCPLTMRRKTLCTAYSWRRVGWDIKKNTQKTHKKHLKMSILSTVVP